MRGNSERLSVIDFDSLYFPLLDSFETNTNSTIECSPPDEDPIVALGLFRDQMLERDHAALPVVVALRRDVLQRRNLTRRFATLETVMPSVAEYQTGAGRRRAPEGRDEVLPLLDGDADKPRF